MPPKLKWPPLVTADFQTIFSSIAENSGSKSPFKSLCHPLHQEFSDHVLFPSNYEDFTRGTVWSVIPQILRRLQVRIAPANGFGNGRSPSSRAKGDHTLRLVAVGHAAHAPAPRAYLRPGQWRSAPDDAMRQHAAAVVSQFECNRKHRHS